MKNQIFFIIIIFFSLMTACSSDTFLGKFEVVSKEASVINLINENGDTLSGKAAKWNHYLQLRPGQKVLVKRSKNGLSFEGIRSPLRENGVVGVCVLLKKYPSGYKLAFETPGGEKILVQAKPSEFYRLKVGEKREVKMRGDSENPRYYLMH